MASWRYCALLVPGLNRKGEPLVFGNPKQAKQNTADALARAEALRPHITAAINQDLTSSNAIAN